MNRGDNASRDILVDYYPGAYGPTLRIATCSLGGLKIIRDTFLSLAEGRVYETRFQEIETVRMTGISSLSLKLVNHEDRKTLRLMSNSSAGPIFCWLRDTEGWQDCVGLIEGLMQENTPGHQYLTSEGIDDAMVEVSFCETDLSS